MVTSSAVVGSSAIQKVRRRDHRHADHHPLPEPPTAGAGTGRSARSGSGLPTFLEDIDHAGLGLAPGHVLVQQDLPRAPDGLTVFTGLSEVIGS
jgi:hypothetical protein